MTSSSVIGSPELYLPVNWADGMKINKDHFRADQRAGHWQQAMHSRAGLSAVSYGLFLATEPQPARPIVVSTDNQQQVMIRLIGCQAITYGGHLIYVREGSMMGEDPLTAAIPGLNIPYAQLAAADASYFVMLAVNPYTRTPAGQPDMTESQLRPPFTAPAYRLELVNCRDIPRETPGDFFLPLARIRVSDGKIQADEDYIPPCTIVNAHSALAEWHADLEAFFAAMENYALRIQQKITQKGQHNELSILVGDLCQTISTHLAAEHQRTLMEYRSAPPVRMIAGLAGLARLMKNQLDIYTGTPKDDLLNYFAEWCQVQQGEWDETMTAASTVRYEHTDIRAALNRLDVFTIFTRRLFASLAELEYIGKKRDAGIFVKEHLVVPAEEMPARRRSFLAE